MAGKQGKRKTIFGRVGVNVTYKILINGIVQGVGFRPYIAHLSKTLGIVGYVANSKKGVVVVAQGSDKPLKKFLYEIENKPPKSASIYTLHVTSIPSKTFDTFSIRSNKESGNVSTSLTPDFRICDSCIKEVANIDNRRYAYPFTTCTHCGPRFSITRKFPFERENLSLSAFTMCSHCQKEYTAIGNRRFHSQTNSCPSCGPTIYVKKADKIISKKIFENVKNLLDDHRIGAIQTPTGYILCCRADSIAAVQKLRIRKQRPEKPFALLFSNVEEVENHFQINAEEKVALTAKEGAIVLLSAIKKTSNLVVSEISPKIQQQGVMLPGNAILYKIASDMGIPLIATSGNISGSPILYRAKEAEQKLRHVADFFINHNLEIAFPQDDSVVKIVDTQKVILRRSKGFAPNYRLHSKIGEKKVLAMGADIKSCFALAANNHLYVSPYLGNLEYYEVLERYEDILFKYCDIFTCIPSKILIDAHPSYHSSRLGMELAKKWGVPVKKVQHHEAHFSSVLSEHQLFEKQTKTLGVIWDGMGWGNEQHIWGGEFFIYSKNRINRVEHLHYFDWLAGNKMAVEPRLSLFSLLPFNHPDRIESKFTDRELDTYRKVRATNKLKTSSMGRLFDAVACILGLIDVSTYEGQAAMLLEQCAVSYKEYDNQKKVVYLSSEFSGASILQGIIDALESGIAKNRIAASFIFYLAQHIVRMAHKYDVNHIACSGGVFQNGLLIRYLKKSCLRYKLSLYMNVQGTPNDENIAYGQIFHNQYIA